RPRAQPDPSFRSVSKLVCFNEAFHATFVSPWVRLMTTPASAEMLKWMHPMRTSRLMFSERFNPWMRLVRQTAESIAETREPLDQDDPRMVRERAAVEAVGKAIERARIARDAKDERTFRALYGGNSQDVENAPHVPV
ncbi:hypothetical protein LCGC14_3078460, partial [marine sediment metagenome]